MNSVGYWLCAVCAVVLLIFAVLTSGCAHKGLAPAMADGALKSCIEWAQENGDLEVLLYCSAADATVPGALSMLAKRKTVRPDAGVVDAAEGEQ